MPKAILAKTPAVLHAALASSSTTAAYPFAGTKPSAHQQAVFESTLSSNQELLYAKFVGFYHGR